MTNSSFDMPIKQILFTGDTLRPDDLHGPHSQSSNIRSFHALFSHQIFEATGIEPKAVYNGHGISYDMAWSLAKKKPSPQNWAGLFFEAPPDLQRYWQSTFEGSLVIGFEIPPSQRQALEIHGIPYIDMMIHPVRFMDDIFLGLHSNHPEIENAIQSQAFPERLVFLAAGAVRAFAIRKKWVSEPRPFSLFAAQIGIDRSLIEGGKLLNTSILLPRIKETVGQPARLLFKDHPYEAQDALVKALSSSSRSVQRVAKNIYGLLSDPNIEEVISVSSSVGIEATYFGVSSKFVIGPSSPVRFLGDTDGNGYWSIYKAYFAPDFWRRVLAPIVNVSDPDGDPPMHRPNLMRNSLRAYWGYKDILTDAYENMESKTPLSQIAKNGVRRTIQKLGLEPAARRALSLLRSRNRQ